MCSLNQPIVCSTDIHVPPLYSHRCVLWVYRELYMRIIKCLEKSISYNKTILATFPCCFSLCAPVNKSNVSCVLSPANTYHVPSPSSSTGRATCAPAWRSPSTSLRTTSQSSTSAWRRPPSHRYKVTPPICFLWRTCTVIYGNWGSTFMS